jgi:purine-binding chemotaxis protein CheW
MPGSQGEAIVGIMADSVHEVLEISPDDLEPPPRFGVGPAAAFVSGIGRDSGGFILVLDIDLILDEEGLGPEPAFAEGA